jgi:YHS domain-containing protein
MIWLRIAILVLLVYLLYLVFRPRKPKDRPRDRQRPIPRDDVMVQDPWCKAYLPKSQAVSVTIKEQEVYFCSVECRDHYLADQTEAE